MNMFFATTNKERRAAAYQQGGFTLIEILIALVVMTIGLLGILALFPASFSRVNKTVQESQAGAIAESVHQAVLAGVHASRTDINGDGTVDNQEGAATMHHAGLINRGQSPKIPEKYTFPLPPAPGKPDEVTSYAFPTPIGKGPFSSSEVDDTGAPWGGKGTGNASDVDQYKQAGGANPEDFIWQLGEVDDGKPANDLTDLIRNIKGKDTADTEFDPSFDLDKYSYSLLIQRSGDERLFRVVIGVYRFYRARSGYIPKPGKSGYDAMTDGTHPDLIKEYRAMVSGN